MVTSSSRVLAFLLLCGACLGLATPEPLTSTLSLSIYPNLSRRTRVWLENRRQKEYALPRSLSKREPGSAGLFDWGDDASYFATVLIGSPRPCYFPRSLVYQAISRAFRAQLNISI